MYCLELAPEADLIESEVGGKARNLGRLMSLGIPVPLGFVLTTRALSDVLAGSRLAARIDEWLKSYSPLERDYNRRAFEGFCAEMRAMPIPQSVQRELTPLVEKLLAGSESGLAVRSSAAHEDSNTASFAGIYESVLCVTSTDAVMAGIVDCWCSLWSPKAVEYALRMEREVSPDGMAVLIQQVVPAISAGVIFTADPVTGNPWRFVASSSLGLADRTVSRNAPSDRYVLEWDTGKVIERRSAPKTQVTAPGSAERPFLSERQLSRLAQLALRIDNAFDARMDIEWAMTARDFVVLQARPIAALPEFFPHVPRQADTETTWQLGDPVWIRSITDYPYWRRKGGTDYMVAPLFGDIRATELWMRHQPTGKGTKVFPRPEGQERDINGYRYTTAWKWGGPWHDRVRTYAWLEANEPMLRKDWDGRIAELRQVPAKTAALLEVRLPLRELVPAFLAMRDRLFDMEAASFAAPQSLGGRICSQLLEAVLALICSTVHVGDLLQGLPSFSLERTMAAQRLVDVCDDDVKQAFRDLPLEKVLPHLQECCPESRFLEALRAFCWDFGLVCATQGTLGRGDLAPQLLVIKNTILGQARDAREQAESCRLTRRSCEERVRTLAANAPDLLSRFNTTLSWAQYWVPALDNRLWVGVQLTCMDVVLQRVAEVLVNEGRLDVPSDVLLFTPEELAEIAKSDDVTAHRALYTDRKREIRKNRRLAPPQQLGVSSDLPGKKPTPVPTAPGADLSPSRQHMRLTGEGLSPGSIAGTARTVRKRDQLALFSSLTRDDIVVCPDPDLCYLDWMSVFMLVKGAVMTWGDMLHHVTQIARECGIVLVNLPVEHACRIPDGSTIALDGTAGTVEIQL